MRVLRSRANIAWLALAIGAACSLLITTGAAAKPRTGKAVTIRVFGSTSAAFAWSIIIKNFQLVNPDITVQYDAQAANVLGANLQTQVRAGNGPDICGCAPGKGAPFQALSYAPDFTADLSDRPWVKRITHFQRVGAQVGTRLYALQLGAAVYPITYNVDLFKQIGVKPPSTWAQMLDTCRKIAAAGKLPIAFAPADVNTNNFLAGIAGNEVYSTDPKWNTERLRGQKTFSTTPGWRTVFQRIVDMKNANCFSPGAQGVTGPAAAAQFATGAAAMFAIPTTQWGLFLSLNPTFDYSVFPYPANKAENQRLVVQPTPTFWVNKTNGADRLAAVLKLVDFIARPKQTETYARATGALVPSEVLRTGKLPAFLDRLKPLSPLFKRPQVVTYTAVWPNGFIAAAAINGIVGLFTGQKTIDQILTDMDNAWV